MHNLNRCRTFRYPGHVAVGNCCEGWIRHTIFRCCRCIAFRSVRRFIGDGQRLALAYMQRQTLRAYP
ncbi:hypothetical protein D3C74_246470 [compost metagenome]